MRNRLFSLMLTVAALFTSLVTRYKNNKEEGFKESSIHSSGTMAADKFPTFLEKYCAETPFMKSSTITVSADGLSEE